MLSTNDLDCIVEFRKNLIFQLYNLIISRTGINLKEYSQPEDGHFSPDIIKISIRKDFLKEKKKKFQSY